MELKKTTLNDKKEVTLRVALRMLEHGIPKSFIMNVTRLSYDDIEKLSKK